MRSDVLLQDTLEQTGLPVKQYEYKGTQPEYIVFNEEDERGADHGDNRPQAMTLWWQVHIYAPQATDFRKRKRQVRNLLLDAGFCIGDIDTFYETETKTVHVVISCSIEEDMEE